MNTCIFIEVSTNIITVRHFHASEIPTTTNSNMEAERNFDVGVILAPITRVYPKVSGLATWSENCKWYSYSSFTKWRW